MTKMEIANNQQKELHGKLWKMVNDLRGNMEAYEFKNYILGVIFYKFLSEKFVAKLLSELETDDLGIYFDTWNEDRELALEVFEDYDYYIQPQYLFSTLIKKIKDETFDIELFHKAINELTEITRTSDKLEVVKVFDNLFEDMDLTSTKLGRTPNARTKLMSKILKTVNTLNIIHSEAEIDVLGDSYEYLISKFASSAGKKAGEFYTPSGPSLLLSKLATVGINEAKTIYDPTAGSGSLLLKVAEELNSDKTPHYYAQELTSTTYNLCRMNMLLHNVQMDFIHIANGDTIEDDKFPSMKFDVQVANPPYSVNWSRAERFKQDPRFSDYGKLPYKSKADFAFVQHMLYHMADDGRVAVLLPHGVLFRSGAEKTIRKHIIDKLNYLDAVVGLPENLFFGTSIPVVALVFKKNRNGNSDNVLFIDASNEYGEKKNQNILRSKDITKIIDTYSNREELERYSHKASLEEIKENDYNLNIPRYVDTFEPEPRIDLEQVRKDINELDEEHEEIKETIKGFFEELGIDREVN